MTMTIRDRKIAGRARVLCILVSLSASLMAEAQNMSIFEQEKYQSANVSVLIKSLDDNDFNFSYQENKSLTTASVAKLMTTATALEMFGSEHRFETAVAYDGQIRNGVLNGNIWIIPGGDPTLGSEYMSETPEAFLKEWCAAVCSLGIRRIIGKINCPTCLFDREAVSPYWMWEDLGNYYAAGVYDVAVFDNMYRLGLQSKEAGSIPEIRYVHPPMPSLQIENHLIAKEQNKDSAYLYGIPYDWHRRLYGSIPANRQLFEIKGDNPDPVTYLCTRFSEALQQAGVVIENAIVGKAVDGNSTVGNGKISAAVDGLDRTVIYRSFSPPLRDIIGVINEKSNNLYTEYLLRHIAIQAGYSLPVSATDGRVAMQQFWQQKGLNAYSWGLCDACGLSPMTSLSAAEIYSILQYMSQKSAQKDVYTASLPMVGKEGTVAGFGKHLSGELRLKSGSMAGVRNYAGYWNVHGHSYAVVILINRANATGKEIQKDIEQFLASLPL